MLTVLCLSSYEKGFEFVRECKRQDCRVLLLTSQSLEDSPWPKESLDEMFYMPDVNKEWNIEHMINAVSFLARSEQIDRIVALDDFDVEKAARLREHLRVPGMGDTTARYFRDKLAMRMRALEVGINVPNFVHVLNYDRIKEYLKRNEAPLILKPRMQAGAVGLKKINYSHELWPLLDELGDKQSYYLLEKFIQGKIFHVDSIVFNKEIVFAIAHEYGLPPMEVAHEGRVFTSCTMIRGSKDQSALMKMNNKLLKALGLVKGISHSEFIKGEDGKLYFLETSARVGGANIAELIEASTGINFWSEWAKIETLSEGKEYNLPKHVENYAGIILSLAKQEWPDLSAFDDKEVYWKMNKRFHAGLIFRSSNYERIEELMKEYTNRFYREFFTSQPLSDKPTD
ncbi:ATPase [bacterium]|nr:ATPase [bacterium]